MSSEAISEKRQPVDVVTASLELARGAQEAMLHRLRGQNTALDRLRSALATEDRLVEAAPEPSAG